MIKFPSIGQFSGIVKQIRDSAEYHSLPLPVLRAEGSVKIHGTNGGITRPVGGGKITAQSRERVLDVQCDNAGFCQWVYSNLDALNLIFDRIERYVPGKTGTVQIFGEWAGKGIHKNVGVNQLDKFFCVFGIRISEAADSQDWEPRKTYEDVFDCRIIDNLYDKYEFMTREIDIDFNNPEASIQEMIDFTNTVENDCPVARDLVPDFGDNPNVGEGVVWQVPGGYRNKAIIWKVKGEKHAVSKVKKLVAVDPEKLANLKSFIEYAVTENRLNQMMDKMTELGFAHDQKHTGEFIKLMVRDVVNEELAAMSASGLTVKEATGAIATSSRSFFLGRINKI